jgi:hypothetical protein
MNMKHKMNLSATVAAGLTLLTLPVTGVQIAKVCYDVHKEDKEEDKIIEGIHRRAALINRVTVFRLAHKIMEEKPE